MFGMMISILLYYYLWRYVFSPRESIRGVTVSEMTTHIVIARILSTQFAGGINKEISTWMYKGNIIIELLRPISLEINSFSRKLRQACSFFSGSADGCCK